MTTRLPFGLPRTIPVAAPATSRLLASGRGKVRRVAFRETTGTATAVVQLFDGTGTNGPLIDTISLAPSESVRDFYAGGEYPFESSLWLQVVSGTVEGSVTVQYLGPGDPHLDVVLALSLSDLEGAVAATTPAPTA